MSLSKFIVIIDLKEQPRWALHVNKFYKRDGKCVWEIALRSLIFDMCVQLACLLLSSQDNFLYCLPMKMHFPASWPLRFSRFSMTLPVLDIILEKQIFDINYHWQNPESM